MSEEGAERRTLEFTSTWVVAVVCCVLVLISFLVHRFLQCVGQLLTRPYTKGPRTGKGRRKHLFNALQKIKDELMLLGFTSLLLSVSEASIVKICIPESHANVWLPCHRPSNSSCTTTAHSANPIASHGHQGRRLLTGAKDYCCRKRTVPLLSPTALHHLHIFIFMLATFHVIVCVVIILCGEAKLHHWRQWDKSIIKDGHYIKEEDLRSLLTRLPKKDSKGGKRCPVIGWLHIFFKHIFSSWTKLEYITIRVNCIKAQDLKTPEDDFQKYIIGSVQKDFDKVVGISWYLWLLTVLFLLLNIAGLNAYFWISFLPLTLLLAVGTKLEHIVKQWTEKITKKSDLSAGASESTVTAIEFSEEDFWFHKPHLVLDLIHIILFQNSFQLAFFFFVSYQYQLSSCMMGEVRYVIPRLVIGVCVQLICSYRTLPLYAIMKSQMRPKNRPKKKKLMKIVTFIWDNIDKWNERKMATNNGSTRGGSSEGIVANEQAKVGEIEPEKEADIELQDGTNPARTLKPGEQQLV